MIGTCSLQKFEYVKSLGVIPVDRFAPDLVDQVRSLSGGEGVDVAYDAVGSEESLKRSHQATKKDVGQVISIGVMEGTQENGNGLRHTPEELFPLLFSRMQARTSLFTVVPSNDKESKAVFVDDFRAIVAKVRMGKLNPEIVKLYRLDQAVEAQEAIISGNNIRGKMVYVVDGELAARQGL